MKLKLNSPEIGISFLGSLIGSVIGCIVFWALLLRNLNAFSHSSGMETEEGIDTIPLAYILSGLVAGFIGSLFTYWRTKNNAACLLVAVILVIVSTIYMSTFDNIDWLLLLLFGGIFVGCLLGAWLVKWIIKSKEKARPTVI